MHSTEEEISEAIATLRSFGVRQVAPMHCTGETAVFRLRSAFINQFLAIEEGSRIETGEGQ